jgi:hypothetical protein
LQDLSSMVEIETNCTLASPLQVKLGHAAVER